MTKYLLALVLGVSVLSVTSGATASTSPAAGAPAPTCSFERLPDDPDASLDANGVARYLAWSQRPANQRSLRQLREALGTIFGPPDADDGLRQLERGLIGLVLDHRQQRFVVVLSRHLRLAEYRERIGQMVPPPQQRGAAPVVVQHGCAASPALLRTMRALDRGRALQGRFAAVLDAADSKVRVTLPTAAGAIPRSLTELPRVAVDRGDPRSRKGRRNADRSPHFGAASISRPNGVTCTSWANVRLPGGKRMGATAGHCGKNGTTWRSGPFYYGKAEGRRNFPEQDSMRLRGKRGHKWGARIHVNGGSRVVVGDNNPRVGDLLCKSGQTTGVVCSIEVVNTHAVARYAGGVNRNLIYAERRGHLVGQGGDSGGPLFERMSNGRAGIRGMEVAGSRPDNLFAEKPRVIRRHLGVAVVKR